jgi:hypothetical protein
LPRLELVTPPENGTPLYPLGICRGADAATVDSIGVRWLVEGELAVALADRLGSAWQPLEHAKLLEAVHRHIDVLPLRFGDALDEANLRNLLTVRRQNFFDQLDCVSGASEIGVRIVLPDVAAPSAAEPSAGSLVSSAAAYLRQRRNHYQRLDSFEETVRQITSCVLERLAGVYRRWRRLASPAINVIRLAFLADRDSAWLCKRCLANYAAEHPESQCTALGPWPPYSFTDCAFADRVPAAVVNPVAENFDVGRQDILDSVQRS